MVLVQSPPSCNCATCRQKARVSLAMLKACSFFLYAREGHQSVDLFSVGQSELCRKHEVAHLSRSQLLQAQCAKILKRIKQVHIDNRDILDCIDDKKKHNNLEGM